MNTVTRVYNSVLDSWTGRHQVLLAGIFIGLNAMVIVIDLFMVEVLGIASISWRTWVAESLFPILSVAGVLVTICICWLVRSQWWLVVFGGLVGGHLFLHW